MPNSETFPLISIIVPVYNVELYLDRCIESLVSQTYENLEIILVDDGSTDACPKICDDWSKKDQRVRVIHKNNGGLSDARNVGLEIAHAKYIVFVDSDDWVSYKYIEYLYKGLCSSGADICECEVLKTNNLQITQNTELHSDLFCYDTETAMKMLVLDAVFHQYVVNKIYKKECIGDIRFIKGKLNEDEFWTYQVFGKAKKIAKIENVLYYYFQRNGSIMRSTYSLKRLDALEAKFERQKYIDLRFPQLSEVAAVNMILSCIYSGQMILLYLTGVERAQALSKVHSYFKGAFSTIIQQRIPAKEKIWINMARMNFVLTCKIRNILKIGF